MVFSTLALAENKSNTALWYRRVTSDTTPGLAPGQGLPHRPHTLLVSTWHISIPPHPSGLFTQTFLPNDGLSQQLQPAEIMKYISILFTISSQFLSSPSQHLQDQRHSAILCIINKEGGKGTDGRLRPGRSSWYRWSSSERQLKYLPLFALLTVKSVLSIVQLNPNKEYFWQTYHDPPAQWRGSDDNRFGEMSRLELTFQFTHIKRAREQQHSIC